MSCKCRARARGAVSIERGGFLLVYLPGHGLFYDIFYELASGIGTVSTRNQHMDLRVE
jgi:hypothetical protein